MTQPVAVIVATYNGEKFLEQQLLSIISQTHNNIHVFIRDDGSTDGTIHISKSLAEKFKNITILKSPHEPTGSAAGNFITALSEIHLENFSFVALSDQDDIWAPEKISNAIQAMRESQAAAYSSELIAFDNSKKISWYVKKKYQQRDFDYIFQGASAGCTYVLRRDAAQLVKLKTRHLAGTNLGLHSHDWLIYAICKSHGLKWHMDDQSFIFYRQHSNNSFGALPNIKGLIARMKLSQTNWYRSHILWNNSFLKNTESEKHIIQKIKRINIFDRIHLATQTIHFRRRTRDVVFLAIAILTFNF